MLLATPAKVSAFSLIFVISELAWFHAFALRLSYSIVYTYFWYYYFKAKTMYQLLARLYWMGFHFPLYDISLNPPDTIWDMADNTMSWYVLNIITHSIWLWKLLAPSRRSQFLLDVQLDTKGEAGIGIARSTKIATGCIATARGVRSSPSHARITAIARVLCSPFRAITK